MISVIVITVKNQREYHNHLHLLVNPFIFVVENDILD